MEDKKELNSEELEQVAGGKAKLDENVRFAFWSAEGKLKNIVEDQADFDFRINVSSKLTYCMLALDGSISAENALNQMQNYCNKINIDYRRAPQNIVNQLRNSLGL